MSSSKRCLANSINKMERLSNDIKQQLDFGGTRGTRYTIPKEKCRKCGGNVWNPTGILLTWACLHCGNTAYYTFGKLVQQVDHIMRSSRKSDFIHSRDRLCVLPKKNEVIKEFKHG